MTMLVLGVGNPDRGDDAAGPLVAAALAEVVGIEARQVTADPSAILTDPLWDTAEQVRLVDTVRTGQRPGSVHRWSGQRLVDHVPATGGGTHDLGIATTLHLAQALGRLPPTLEVIGIEGAVFEVGHPPCRAVRHAVAMVAAALAREVDDTAVDALQIAVRVRDLQLTLRGERRNVRVGQR